MNPSLKQQFHKNVSPCSSKIVKQWHTIIRIKSIIVIDLVHFITFPIWKCNIKNKMKFYDCIY
jgi:hypothetical protein